MAKKFLDQAFSIFGLKSPSTTDYYDPSVYKAEASTTVNDKPAVSQNLVAKKMTSVDKYQQRKKRPHSEAKDLSGVEKYLAAKQQTKKEISTEECAEKQLTGVAKYLSLKQQEQQATIDNMTGVAKYLYYLENPHKKPPVIESIPEEKKEDTPVKLSRVDRYIAKQQEVTLEKQTEKSVVEPSQNEPEVTPEIKPEVKQQVIPQASKEAEKKTLDLAVEAERCQATTGKGTQCSRKKNLQAIERTIDTQGYKFSVCRQHNIDSFIPYQL